MRSSVCLTVLAATLTTAVPLASPQGIDFDVYEEALADLLPVVDVPAGDVTQVVHYNPSLVQSSAIAGATSGDLQKRGTCAAYPPGGGPAVNTPDDTAQAFLNYPQFASDATNANAPSNYKLIPGFQNLQASASSTSYMGVNSSLTSYDPSQCAYQCDHREGCVSFNIFYERDPTEDADDNNCPNPASMTLIKCSLWGLALGSSSATNTGQYQSQFQVVIAGSNAYANTPAPISGFSGPTSLGAAIIQPPSGDTSYMGQQTFPNSPYQPQACADACNTKSAYNTRHAAAGTTPRICRFFDAYILYKDNASPMFTCTYYTQAWDPSYATNNGQYGGSPESHYTMTQSYTYTLNSS